MCQQYEALSFIMHQCEALELNSIAQIYYNVFIGFQVGTCRNSGCNLHDVFTQRADIL